MRTRERLESVLLRNLPSSVPFSKKVVMVPVRLERFELTPFAPTEHRANSASSPLSKLKLRPVTLARATPPSVSEPVKVSKALLTLAAVGVESN